MALASAESISAASHSISRQEGQQQQAKRKQLPLPSSRTKPMVTCERLRRQRPCTAQFHRQERNVVTEFRAAYLHFGGDFGSGAADDGRPEDCRGCRFAWFVEEHKALHQGHRAAGVMREKASLFRA